MKIKELIEEIEMVSLIGSDELQVSGISYDSRKVEPGHLFFAMQGEKTDGHSFIESAVKKGAIAIIHDKEIADSGRFSPFASLIRVKDSRKSLAFAANTYYQMPSRAMTVIGITGTNGKTTTTYILKSILEAWGKKVGLIGTIQHMISDVVYPATHTTPESLEFQALLHEMRRCRLQPRCDRDLVSCAESEEDRQYHI